MSKLFERYQDDVQFLFVYIREAHPIDGPRPNLRVRVKDPKSTSERAKLAKKFVTDFELNMPVLVDGIDDKVSRAYDARPDRLFLVDAEGNIGYVGNRGPRGFEPDELEKAILEELKKLQEELDAKIQQEATKKGRPVIPDGLSN